jgi:hypothetical protein
MARKRFDRGSLVVLALGGLLGSQRGTATAAEHIIGVAGGISNASCGTPTPNNSYYVEAWGFDALGRKVCELFINPAAPPFGGNGQCNPVNPLFPATQHAPRITLRSSSTLQFVQALPTVPTNPPLTTWVGLSPQITHTIPAHGTCGATTITALSFGLDTP